MSVSTIVMYAGILVGTAALYLGYFLADLDGFALGVLAVGLLWLLAQWKRVYWYASPALLAFVSAAAYGLWISLPASLMTLGAVGGLLGWDLADFTRRLRTASPKDDTSGMERRHMARVSIVSALGLVIAGLTAFVRVQIPFELALLLVLLAAVGLTRLVAWLQRYGGE